MKLRVYADVKYYLALEDAPLTNVIYCLTFPNGKKYIGQTTQTLKERIRCHIKDSFCDRDYNFAKARAIRKYMEFSVSVLYQGDNLSDKEKEFIELYKTFGKEGYNMTSGGEGSNYIMSDITKQRISDAKKGVPNKKLNKIVLQYTLDGEFIKEWESISLAAESISSKKCVISKISECSRGKRKTAYNFI